MKGVWTTRVTDATNNYLSEQSKLNKYTTKRPANSP